LAAARPVPHLRTPLELGGGRVHSQRSHSDPSCGAGQFAGFPAAALGACAHLPRARRFPAELLDSFVRRRSISCLTCRVTRFFRTTPTSPPLSSRVTRIFRATPLN